MRMLPDKSLKPRRLGRPPRVTAAQIADAALAIGLDRATVRNVAERLGMSVPGLYHHVRTREELLAMAAAHSLGTLALPAHEGQPLEDWLISYARFVYDALLAQPELVGQILAGTVHTLRLAQHIERFLEVLTGSGRTVADAYDDYALLMAAVTGGAASAIGRAASFDAGHPTLVDLRRAAKALGGDDAPLVQELLRRRRREPDPFDVVRVAIGSIVECVAGGTRPVTPRAQRGRSPRVTRDLGPRS
jgi:AcrR family transcriptional regulator